MRAKENSLKSTIGLIGSLFWAALLPQSTQAVEISDSDIIDALGIIQTDQESQGGTLIQDAIKAVGGKSIRDLAQVIHSYSNEETKGLKGYTTYEMGFSFRARKARRVYQMADEVVPKTFLDEGQPEFMGRQPLDLQQTITSTGICLNKAQITDKEDLISTIAHELVHFANTCDEINLDQIDNDEDYFMATLDCRGDEVDAHILQYSQEIRRGIGDRIPARVKQAQIFDDRGRYVGGEDGRSMIAQHLLDNGYRDQAESSLHSFFDLENEKLRVLNETLELRRETPGYDTSHLLSEISRSKEKLENYCRFSDLLKKSKCGELEDLGIRI